MTVVRKLVLKHTFNSLFLLFATVLKSLSEGKPFKMFPKSLIFVVLSALFFLSCDVNADLTVSTLCRELSGLQRFFEESPKHTHKHPLTCYIPPSSLQRQDVIDNHQRRRSQLQKLVEDAKVQLADHHSGRKLMETEEFEKIDKRVRLYEQKINRMGETIDEDVSTIVLTMITSKDAEFRDAEHIFSSFRFFFDRLCESLLPS